MRWIGLLLLSAVAFFPACHPRISPDTGKAESSAESLLFRLYSRNKSLKTFKGIGRISIWSEEGAQSARIAWLASVRGRMRAEVLGPAGRPLLKIAYDGEVLYFYKAGMGEIKKKRIDSPDLGSIMEVPVEIGDLVLFLAGRFPVYDYARIEKVDTGPDTGEKLVLKSLWSNVVEKISFFPGSDAVESVQVFDWRGLRYRADLSGYSSINGYSVPGRIMVKGSEGAGFEIRVSRFWANAEAGRERFVISAVPDRGD